MTGELGQHEHRAVKAEHEPVRANPIPSEAGGVEQYVQAGLRRRPEIPPQEQSDLVHQMPCSTNHFPTAGCA